MLHKLSYNSYYTLIVNFFPFNYFSFANKLSRNSYGIDDMLFQQGFETWVGTVYKKHAISVKAYIYISSECN